MSEPEYVLSHGAHTTFEEGSCLLELCAHLAGAPHSASPPCVSPVLAAYGIACNDAAPSTELRQTLLEFAPRMLNTADDGPADLRRAYIAADYAVRVFAPIALRAAELEADAVALEALPPIRDEGAAGEAAEAAGEAASAAEAAGEAASAAEAAGEAAEAASAAWAARKAAEAARKAAVAARAARAARKAAVAAVAARAARKAAWAAGAARAAWAAGAAGAARGAAWERSRECLEAMIDA